MTGDWGGAERSWMVSFCWDPEHSRKNHSTNFPTQEKQSSFWQTPAPLYVQSDLAEQPTKAGQRWLWLDEPLNCHAWCARVRQGQRYPTSKNRDLSQMALKQSLPSPLTAITPSTWVATFTFLSGRASPLCTMLHAHNDLI